MDGEHACRQGAGQAPILCAWLGCTQISMWKTDRLMRPIHVVAYDEPQAKIKHIIIGEWCCGAAFIGEAHLCFIPWPHPHAHARMLHAAQPQPPGGRTAPASSPSHHMGWQGVSFVPPCRAHPRPAGPQEDNPETGTPITVAVYTVSNGSSAIIKWCNDQGYSGLVQVGARTTPPAPHRAGQRSAAQQHAGAMRHKPCPCMWAVRSVWMLIGPATLHLLWLPTVA